MKTNENLRFYYYNELYRRKGGSNMDTNQWILCPICSNKTRIQIRKETELKYFPLFCPKCKRETLINVEHQTISVIKLAAQD